jgi:hypothetical protein
MPHHFTEAKTVTILDRFRTFLSAGYYREGLIKFLISSGQPSQVILLPFRKSYLDNQMIFT